MRVLCKRDTLFGAWRSIRRNGQQSLSAQTKDEINRFDAEAANRLGQLQWQLSHRRFEFTPQLGVAKRRRGRAPRPLVIGAIENRVVQRALLDILQSLPPVQEILSIKTSLGGIAGRGREHAMALVTQAIKDGARYFIRSDIEAFFTHIPRNRVISFISRLVNDDDFCKILTNATDTNLSNLEQLGDDALLFPLWEMGVAQGSPLSPLIGNVLLRGFDRELNNRGIICIRYIDDFLILGTNERAVHKAFYNAQKLLNEFDLRAYEPLRSSKAESGEVRNGFDFLGCHVSPGLIQPSRFARMRIATAIEEILSRGRRDVLARGSSAKSQRGQTYGQTLVRLDRLLKGWGHAYAFCNGRQSFASIDEFVDRQVIEFRRCMEHRLVKLPARNARRLLGIQSLVDTPLAALPIKASR
jgi:retron-type reverse transcriptase